jgi:hypothetical protein
MRKNNPKCPRFLSALSITAFAICSLVLAACSDQEVSFQSDVESILKEHCAECHTKGGRGFAKSGFLVDSYAHVMRGTRYGPVIVPGAHASSTLYRLIAGEADPSIRMPFHRDPLPREKVELIAAWIDQGAKNN